ncbi:MAG: hypothetical protein PUC71_09095 [Oscillospiraceae bacterium]|nr:hypothetical protein [Oscillospiraceae bacterium]
MEDAAWFRALPECGPPRRKIAQNPAVEVQQGCVALQRFYHFFYFDTDF